MPMIRFLPSVCLLSLSCLLVACQTFKDGDAQLYEQSGKLLDDSLKQAQAAPKVMPPLAVQAAMLAQSAPSAVFSAFCVCRFAGVWGLCFGSLGASADLPVAG